MSNYLCRVCGSRILGKQYTAREMMFGSRDEFIYDACGECDSIQISAPLTYDELFGYYTDSYYSFSVKSSDGLKAEVISNKVRRRLAVARDRHVLYEKSLIGYLLEFIRPAHQIYKILELSGSRKGKAILDVGCGAGAFLNTLSEIGLEKLGGVDAFLQENIQSSNGKVDIKRGDIFTINQRYDIIMYNHSFEHVAAPIAELQEVRRALNKDGVCLIRVPTPSSVAWEHYGVNWAQFDAPRHCTLISRKGMTALAKSCGFVVKHIIDDSTWWSLAASELYKQNIPLVEQHRECVFSSAERAEFARKAAEYNSLHVGDQAAFILSRVE